jgi:glycosyltransferase involved in cell wall biosynthesis
VARAALCYNVQVSNQIPTSARVGLDAHLLSLAQNYRGAGINGYIYQLLRHLPAVDDGLCYTAYLHEPGFRGPSGLSVCMSRWDTRNPLRRIVWEQTRLAWRSRSHDMLHGLAFAAPLAAACPTVITVHDLSFLRYPGAFRRFNRYYLAWMTRVAARRAARVIAVSESTRQDVISLCGVPGERVVTIPNGVTEDFCPASAAEVAGFRQRKGLPDRFILFVGTLEPRKNLVRLLDAYALWRRTHYGEDTGCPVKLVIAGGKGWFYDRVFQRVQELALASDVIFPGYVSSDELPWWYRAAAVFVYPSRFEGFGLPVLEAMACGTPVITTTASSLPEVAGDAAWLVGPEDTEGLAAAIERVLSDPGLAAQLRAMGLRRAAEFSWARTAMATARLYRAVLGGPV